MFRQKPVKGGRNPLPSCVMQSIWNEVDRQAKKFNVSRSFVIATALAHTFGIRNQEDYKLVDRRKKDGKRR